MVDTSEFRRLVSTGLSASRIAKALGISRQRAYQIAKQHQLLFAGQERKRRLKPKPSHVTDRDLANLERQVNSLLATIHSLREKLHEATADSVGIEARSPRHG